MANTLKEGEERLAGEVTEVAPGAQFRVKLDNGKEILAQFDSSDECSVADFLLTSWKHLKELTGFLEFWNDQY